MKPVVRFCIRQAVLVNVVFAILTIAGAFALFTIPLENMPDVDIGKVFVHTVYFGASPDDVEQLVTIKMEEALDGLEEVEFIQSSSYRNFSSIQVKFNDDTDYEDLYDDLRFRALNAKDELPAEADQPTFTYIDTHIWIPVVMVHLSGDAPQKTLKLLAKELKSQLLAVPGVQTVDILGEFEREFHVSVDPARLRETGITFFQVAEAIRSANTRIPTGRFSSRESETMLDAGAKFASQREVLDVVVRRDGDGNFIRVRDLVTSARMSHRDPSVIPSINGKNTILLRVLKQEHANAVSISRDVKRTADQFAASHAGEGIRMVYANDSTLEINDSVNTLGGNLILGMALVTLLLWVTLGFRNALLTAVGIPFSFLCSVILMKATGVSMNTISLFAFVLLSGMLVDDAVVIVENVYRHLQMGKPRVEAIVDGTSEVMLSVINAVMTTIVAFLPMLIMSGSTGEFFSYIPKTVAYALVASLFECLFILPIHILDWGPRPAATQRPGEEEDPFVHLRSGLFAPLWRIYHPVVRWLLDHKVAALAGTLLLFLVSMTILGLSITGVMPLIQVKFFPGNYFRYHVNVLMPPGTTIERTDAVVRDISSHIASLGPGQAQSAAGSAGYYEDQDYQRHSGGQYGEIVVTLPEDSQRDFPDNPGNDPMSYLEFIRKHLAGYVAEKYPGARGPVLHVFEEADGPPTGKPVNIRITGTTLDEAAAATDLLMNFMRSEPDLADLVELADDRPLPREALRFLPRQEAVYEYGLRPGDVTALVAGAFNGYPAGRFRDVDEEVDLLVRLARVTDEVNPGGAGLSAPEDVLDVPVVEHPSAPILLRDLVTARTRLEPTVRHRYKGRPSITITANIRSGSPLSATRVQVLVNRFFEANRARMSGVAISHGGEFESTSRSYTSLAFAFVIALMLIYMLLASQFHDYIQPAIIISSVGFALIGVIMGLFLTRTVFTIGSFMAIVGLAGVAVNDSLIIIDFINTRLRAGRPLRDAVIEACAARMRPVLITTVTTLLGLLPMAIGIPRKSISWAPMATAFVAGLSSATLLTLLMIPVEYEAFERSKGWIKDRLSRWKNRKASRA